MIVAIPNNENMVNQHFGRSTSFIIATIDNKEIKDIKEVSTAEFTHQHGALAKMLISNNVKVAIVGGIGKGALDALDNAGIEVIKGASGEYKSILNEFINGTLESKDIVCNHNGEHHGDHHHHH
jgi:predicted Fe-Mo cluster-binding NifX family protein